MGLLLHISLYILLSASKLILTVFRLIFWSISDHRAGKEREELPLYPSKPGKLYKKMPHISAL